jgi:hypothetical protein
LDQNVRYQLMQAIWDILSTRVQIPISCWSLQFRFRFADATWGGNFRQLLMKLTAETFEELVASLKAQRCPDNAARKSARVGLHVSAQMLAIEEHGVPPERHTVNIRDLSVEGLNIVHHSQMRQGRAFVIELPREVGPALRMLCVVRHCRMVGSNLYSIGAIFRSTVANGPIAKSAAA